MNKVSLIVGLVLMTGCSKHPLGVTHDTPSGPPLFVFGGQSNSVFLAANIGETFMDGSVITTGVSGTPMVRWTPGGDLYGIMAQTTANTLKARPGTYIAGLVFWQGETDAALGPSEYNQWPTRFRSMVDDYRRRFGNMPVAFVQITDTHTAGRDELRALQAGIYIPGVIMVPTEGITQVGDHTDAAGYAVMASRVQQALKGMRADVEYGAYK